MEEGRVKREQHRHFQSDREDATAHTQWRWVALSIRATCMTPKVRPLLK